MAEFIRKQTLIKKTTIFKLTCTRIAKKERGVEFSEFQLASKTSDIEDFHPTTLHVFIMLLPTVYFQAIKSTLIFLIKTAVKIYICNCEKSWAYCNTLNKTKMKDF